MCIAVNLQTNLQLASCNVVVQSMLWPRLKKNIYLLAPVALAPVRYRNMVNFH